MSEEFTKVPGEECHGFVLREVTRIDELNLDVLRLDHEATGARMVHLECDDDNNLFGVAFKTPPSDSTGVAHILEHTVLCGSRRYPVRDPFFSMLKRSLNTFMNALTASDWTLYPFSTQNRKDFYNLMDIYLDAVFFPLLRERDFSQEGHRLEFAVPSDPASPLEFKGVVFNEMKGAMADPSSLLAQRLATHLFPATTYRFNSGGEPADIPSLAYEGLRGFHDLFYHPSNAYFFTYGNMPLSGHLKVIQDRALEKFSRIEVPSEVPPETRRTVPVRFVETFPVSPGEPLARKSMVQVAWLASDIAEPIETLSLRLLSSLLLGNPAAPLHRALLESKLGTNLAPGTGYHDDCRTTYFSAGLQGTEQGSTGAVEDLILSTLERVAKEGFPPERVEGAIHRLEFVQREVAGDHYPYPLLLMFRILGQWIHCDDPVTPLRLGDSLRALRENLKQGGYLESLVERSLSRNPHRVTLTLNPDPERGKLIDDEFRRKLGEIRSHLGDEDIERIVHRAEELKRVQEAQDDLSCLPTLELGDVPATEKPVPWRQRDLQGKNFHWFDQPTNGIGYFVGHFSLAGLPGDCVPYVPLFCSMLSQIGAAGHTYVEMARRIEAGTGGVFGGANVLNDPRDVAGFYPLIVVSGKALIPKQDELFGILSDMVGAPDFTDRGRLETLLLQIRTSLENSIPGSGHSYARGHAAGALSPAARLREEWSGLEYLRFVKSLAEEGAPGIDRLAGRFEQITGHVLGGENFRAAVTAEERDFARIEEALQGFVASLPGRGGGRPPGYAAAEGPVHRGWATSVPVSYVARVYATVPYTHEDATVLMVLARLMRASYLHREIREKGGAYGGMALYSPEGGLFSFVSYRDPHIARTLAVYDDALEWVVSGEFDEQLISEAILAVFSDLDRPLSPGGRGRREFNYLCQGSSPGMRQAFRERVLSVSRDDLVRCAAHYLAERREESAVTVVSSRDMIEAANRGLGREQLEIRDL